MSVPRLANELWCAANLARWARFRAAVGDPGPQQRLLLQRCLRDSAETAFGRRHCFATLGSVRQYQRQVPLSSYDDYQPWIDDIRRGGAHVLTRASVTRLVPSSGSVAARKLIPYTAKLIAEFNRAIGPWIVELFRRRPELKGGSAYWSVSPIEPLADDPPASVPVGFDDDAAYLGGAARRIVERSLAVPASVRHIVDVDTFRYVTLRLLLGARELRLISVWHPSFLTLLLDALPAVWGRLLCDVALGTLAPSLDLAAPLRRSLERRLRPDPRRADELARHGPHAPDRLWPRLGLISCWGHGHASSSARRLGQMFPAVEIQPKGLVATEALVTLPFAGGWPLAVRSHFFEFLDERGRPRLADELADGAEYEVVVTTGGGLYRYRLGDRVRVDGFIGRTPSLRFVGRADGVSDRYGEKVHDAHAARLLDALLPELVPDASFALLAPDERDVGLGYTLYVETRREPPVELARRLEQGLCANYHYRGCRALGQLEPARVFHVEHDAYRRFVEACRRKGQRLGSVKPAALSPDADWRRVFRGRYVDAEPSPRDADVIRRAQ